MQIKMFDIPVEFYRVKEIRSGFDLPGRANGVQNIIIELSEFSATSSLPMTNRGDAKIDDSAIIQLECILQKCLNYREKSGLNEIGIIGKEPTNQFLVPLVRELSRKGFYVGLYTNGITFPASVIPYINGYSCLMESEANPKQLNSVTQAIESGRTTDIIFVVNSKEEVLDVKKSVRNIIDRCGYPYELVGEDFLFFIYPLKIENMTEIMKEIKKYVVLARAKVKIDLYLSN